MSGIPEGVGIASKAEETVASMALVEAGSASEGDKAEAVRRVRPIRAETRIVIII